MGMAGASMDIFADIGSTISLPSSSSTVILYWRSDLLRTRLAVERSKVRTVANFAERVLFCWILNGLSERNVMVAVFWLRPIRTTGSVCDDAERGLMPA